MKPNQESEEKIATNRSHRRRCPDFDSECADVRDHLFCFIGDERTGPAGGYCPYLMGAALERQERK